MRPLPLLALLAPCLCLSPVASAATQTVEPPSVADTHAAEELWSVDEVTLLGAPEAGQDKVDAAATSPSDAASDAATSAATEDAATPSTDPNADAAPSLAADQARRARAHLQVAARVEALVQDGHIERVPLPDYVTLVQRDMCSITFGDVTFGAGAACMAAPTSAEQGDDEDGELALCAEQGGVLVSRMPACNAASQTLAQVFAAGEGEGDEDADDAGSIAFADAMVAFGEVARACWARTLCVQ